MTTKTGKSRFPRWLAAAASLLVGVALVGCEDGGLTAPSASLSRSAAPSHAISVLTWNMYVGTDVDAVVAALLTPSTADDLPAIQQALATLQETDVSVRAAAIADQVAKLHPDVLGFEEVSEIHADLETLLGIPGTLDLDYLSILQDALSARGLDYDVAVVGPGVNVTLPGVSLADHDVLLVDPDRVTVSSTTSQAFTYNVGTISTGVSLIRGWAQTQVTVHGTDYTIVDTHPESGEGTDLENLRAAQVGELVGALATAERVILMGDFNDVPGSPMYDVVTNAGYTDSWHAMRPGVDGYTCCHLPDLSDMVGALDQRIDYIFTRGVGRSGPGLQGKIDRIGDVPSDRVQGPDYKIWPSDHAGLVASLLATPVTHD